MKLFPLLLLLLLLLIAFVGVSSHSHSHSHEEDLHAHSHEPAHLKYSREVNEQAQQEEKGHGHSHHQEKEKKMPPPSKDFDSKGPLAFLNDPHTRLWVYSIGSTLLISAFPFFILAFIPIQANTSENSTLLKILLAFGAGGLLGDAFLHLIPHATPHSSDGHSHSHSHSHSHAEGHSHEPHDMSVGGWVLTGFMVFFIVEKFVRIIRGEDGHSHSHSHSPIVVKKKKAKDSDEDEEVVTAPPKAEAQQIRVAAYLNFVADIMHNFTDGLAIGASFIAGPAVGVVTMITVLVHEIPHEIGDFAILVQSGCSKKKAMFTQLLTAVGALGGCVVSLWSVDAYALAEAAEQSWVLPFTAGGFIYIATVSVIPELLEGSTFLQSVMEVSAILLGVFMMYLIALYE